MPKTNKTTQKTSKSKKTTKSSKIPKKPTNSTKTTKSKKSKEITQTTQKAGRVETIEGQIHGQGFADFDTHGFVHFGGGTGFVGHIQGDRSQRDYTAAELIELNTNYVSIALNRNTNTLATIPIHLYFNIPGNKKIESTGHKAITEKQFKHIKAKCNFKQLQDVAVSKNIVEITEHPVLDLLAKVNDGMNYVDFVEVIQNYLGLIGNSYVKIEKDEDGMPTELNPLRSENVVPVVDPTFYGHFESYKYELPRKKIIKYKPEEIIHFLNYVPGSNLIGRGELEICLSAQERYIYYDAFEKFLNRNFGRPDYIIAFKHQLKKKDMEEAYRQFNQRFQGVTNVGKPMITSGDLNVIPLGFSPKDMQNQFGRESSVLEIINAFGVPEALVKLNAANLASSLTAQNIFLKFTIFPKMAKFLEKLNEQLVPLYDDNLFLWFEDELSSDPAVEDKGVLEAFAAGVITKEEAREKLGYDVDQIQEPIEGGKG